MITGIIDVRLPQGSFQERYPLNAALPRDVLYNYFLSFVTRQANETFHGAAKVTRLADFHYRIEPYEPADPAKGSGLC